MNSPAPAAGVVRMPATVEITAPAAICVITFMRRIYSIGGDYAR